MTKPKPLKVQHDNLPDTLKQEAKFCLWRYEQDGKGKWAKVPYNPNSGRHGSSTDPGTFSDYQTAARQAGNYDGIGIGIFNNVAAIDIDHCITDGGELTEAAADIVQTMQSYTEKSPSGTGLRIIFTLPGGFSYDEGKYYKKHPRSGIEIYLPGHTARYVTITGNVTGQGRQIEERGAQVLTVLEKYMRRAESTAAAEERRGGGGLTRDEALQEIRRSWRQILPTMTDPARARVNGGQSYICPLCGNGRGADGDGLTWNPKSRDGNGLKCFRCGFSGDILDLYQEAHGTDFKEALAALAQELNIDIEPYRDADRPQKGADRPQDGSNTHTGTNTPAEAESRTEGAQRAQEGKADYMRYYEECRERITDPAAAAYLEGRGISVRTAYIYNIGYDPQADPASAPGGNGIIRHPAPRLIIPTSIRHYVARAIDPETPQKYAKMNPKGGKPGIFNMPIFDSEAQEVFVTEGAFDALAVIEAGGDAVAINSTEQAGRLIEKLKGRLEKKKRIAATLIICLDNDDAGRKAAGTIREGLRGLDIGYITADICGGYKDPNEFWQKDRAGFTAAVQAAKMRTAAKPDSMANYISAAMADEIAAFRADIKTGFENLDRASGGLYPGFYVVAAISSLGKTTFCHQIADQAAAAGTDVLYFSLEMSRLEMASKSIARATAQKDPETAVTSLSIRKGYLPQHVLAAAKEYQETAGDRMNVIEGNFSCNITFIGDYIRRYISKNNDVRPLVIIDYLQIVTPEEVKGKPQTTKEAVDAAVTQLKRLSRELGITIIAISSVNRANYLTPIDFESLKESGIIEFSADVVWGLQLHCLEADPLFSEEKKVKAKRERIKDEKARTPRMIDLICLKNRFGVASYKCSFEYYPANDLFKPVADFSEATETTKRRRI